MGEPRYRLKLYGHTSQDPKLFCTKLAAVLAIFEDEAGALLDDVPVVILENVHKERAETLLEGLKSIQALCLVEPMEEHDTAEQPASTAPTAEEQEDKPSLSDSLTLRVPILEPEQKEEIRSHFWLGVAGAAGAVLLIMVVVGLFYAYKDVSTTFGDRTRSEQAATTVTNPVAETARQKDVSEEIDFVESEIDRLKADQDQLEFRIADQLRTVNSLSGGYGVPQERYQEERARLAEMHSERRTQQRELRDLEEKLKRLKRTRRLQEARR